MGGEDTGSRITPAEIISRQYRMQLRRRQKYLEKNLSSPSLPQVQKEQDVIRYTEAKPIDVDIHVVTQLKPPGLVHAGELQFCECPVNHKSAAEQMSSQNYSGNWLPPRSKMADKDYIMYSSLNRDRFEKRPRLPIVRFAAVRTTGDNVPYIHFNYLLFLKEQSLVARLGVAEGRKSYQYVDLMSVPEEGKEFPYKYRGYDVCQQLIHPTIFVLDQIDQTFEQEFSKQMEPFQIKKGESRKTGHSAMQKDMLWQLQPSLGSFAEGYINGEVSDTDLMLAARLLHGLKEGEYMAVKDYALEESQLNGALKRFALVEFLLNLRGKWFTFTTRPTSGFDAKMNITFLDVDFADARYRKNVFIDPDSVIMLRRADIYDGQEEVRYIHSVLKTELLKVRQEGVVNPVRFYNVLAQQLD